MIFKRNKPSPKTQPHQQSQAVATEPSYIARDTTVEGNVMSDGEIHIDGMLQGSLRAQTCLIDKHGEVRGEISAEFVYVRGRVMGPISARHVQIEAGAHVEGDVINETISIENGAYVLGSIRRANPAPGAAPDPFAKLEAPTDIAVEPDLENVRLFKTPK